MSTELQSLKLVPGTPCDNLNGYCDVFAVCRRVDMEGPLLRLKRQFFTVEGKKKLHSFYFFNFCLHYLPVSLLVEMPLRLCSDFFCASCKLHFLSHLENSEHLKYFGNVYCVMTNHNGDQDMRANHKLITVAAYSLVISHLTGFFL